MYKELVEYLIKSLVVNQDEVNITEETKETGKTTIKVKVASIDMGRVIGKDGRIIRSVRNIVSAYASKNNTKVSVEIVEVAKQNDEE